MDATTATTNLIDHLAWPVIVLAICLVFRGPIAGFIGRLKSVTTPSGWRLDSDTLAALSTGADALNESADVTSVDVNLAGPVAVGSIWQALEAVAETKPRDAVIGAHDVLVAEMTERLAVGTNGAVKPRLASPSALARMLSSTGVISESAGRQIEQIAALATSSAREVQNGADVTVDEAKAYVGSTREVVDFLTAAVVAHQSATAPPEPAPRRRQSRRGS